MGLPARFGLHILTLLIVCQAATPAAAQTRGAGWPVAVSGLPPLPQPAEPALSPGTAFLASALVPGAGQFAQGADRWVPYLAVEAWAWIMYWNRRSEARTLERRYRDLAWSVARRVSTGPRRDSIFEYYEDMTRYTASGAFDADPRQSGVQPELDRETFNGDLWLLARALFSNPVQALAYYESRAIPPSFAWAWGDSNLEQQVFVELIRESDEAFRHATTALGILLANHMVSAVDALVLGRLQSAAAGDRRFRLRGGLERDLSGLRWTSSLTVRF